MISIFPDSAASGASSCHPSKFCLFAWPAMLFITACAAGAIPADEQAEIASGVSELSEEEQAAGFERLFDGRSTAGWNGSSTAFRIEQHAVVGGNLTEKIPHNEFLATDRAYADFELRLQFRLIGERTNAGIQIRSRRIPDHHEMIGYQADLGAGYWGALYDESRRRKVLASPDAELIAKVLKPGEWNDYRIRCEGKRIQLWINGQKTVDYTEAEDGIEQTGLIALQIHGGPPGEAWYRNIRILPLSSSEAAESSGSDR